MEQDSGSRGDRRPAGEGGARPVRAGGRFPDLVLAIGWLALVVESGLVVVGGVWGEIPWIASTGVGLVAATVVRRRRPALAQSSWFALISGTTAIVQLADVSLSALHVLDAVDGVIASANLLSGLASALGGVAAIHLYVLFPDGIPTNRLEGWVPRASWAFFAVPLVVSTATPLVAVPWYVDIPPTDNLYHFLPFALDLATANAIEAWTDMAFVGALGLLALRYRRLDADRRRQVRWLLVPLLFSGVAVALNLVVGDGAPGLVNLVSIGLPAMNGVAVAVALLRPEGIDVDRILRRSLVYGLLWVVIAGAYSAAAAAVGFAAGRRLSVSSAVLLTVVATLVFQPARTRLQAVADRWVFGSRSDPTRTIARLGATLADTYDLETLLPRMATTLEDGLGLTWARVRLDGEATAATPPTSAALIVPIVLGDEGLGVVECGPRQDGDLTEDDRAVVGTLARQAALAVRNVRLTAQLADQAERLAASRTRLVRAQESERRRIERNIHDGVQQELVALIAQAGRLGRVIDQDPDEAAAETSELQDGLRRVLGDLRELAAGIHPSLLSDRGLLAAVESLAARNPVPVTLRADPTIRSLSTSAEVEGAAYFTIAEALANSLKHAEATAIDVTLARRNGSLLITIRDDGCGFQRAADTPSIDEVGGTGLDNLGERVAAIGGRMHVEAGVGVGTTVTAILPVEEA